MKKSIFIITGEASGESHSVQLITQITKINSEIEFTGIGGKLLKGSGVNLIQDYNEINFIGFSSVIKNYFRLKKSLKNTIDYIKKSNP